MKRLFLIWTILLFAILLIACAPSKKHPQSDVTTTLPGNSSSTAMTTVPWVTSQLPNTQAAVAGYIRPIVYAKEYKSDKGVEALNVRAMLPEIVLYDETLPGDTINETVSAILDGIDSDITRIASDYLSSDPVNFFVTPSYDVFFTLETFTNQTVSFCLKHAITTAEGQYRTFCRYYNVSLRTGRVITASQLFESDKAFAAFVSDKLKSAGISSLYSDPESVIAANLEGAWYISDAALHLSFPMGAIAPESAGMITLDPVNSEILPLLSASGKLFLGIG